MASLDLRLTCTNQPSGAARIEAAISNPEGIPGEVFVITVADLIADDSYDRVATPHDIQTWPSIRDATLAFYRSSTATLNFTDITTAVSAKTDLQSSVKRTLNEYTTSQTSFVEVLDVNLESAE